MAVLSFRNAEADVEEAHAVSVGALMPCARFCCCGGARGSYGLVGSGDEVLRSCGLAVGQRPKVVGACVTPASKPQPGGSNRVKKTCHLDRNLFHRSLT